MNLIGFQFLRRLILHFIYDLLVICVHLRLAHSREIVAGVHSAVSWHGKFVRVETFTIRKNLCVRIAHGLILFS